MSSIGAEAQSIHLLYADLGRGGLRLENVHYLSDELVQWHCTGIVDLSVAHQFLWRRKAE
jgi:hypothetical protein